MGVGTRNNPKSKISQNIAENIAKYCSWGRGWGTANVKRTTTLRSRDSRHEAFRHRPPVGNRTTLYIPLPLRHWVLSERKRIFYYLTYNIFATYFYRLNHLRTIKSPSLIRTLLRPEGPDRQSRACRGHHRGEGPDRQSRACRGHQHAEGIKH